MKRNRFEVIHGRVVDTKTNNILYEADCCNYLNRYYDDKELLECYEDRLYHYFMIWFEEERLTDPTDFCKFWQDIKHNKKKINR